MKKILLIIILFPTLAHCQLYLKIDSLFVHDIVESLEKDIIEEGFGEGPFIYGFLKLYNRSNTTFEIHGPVIYVDFYYEYEGKQEFSLLMNWIPEPDPHSLVVLPMDSIYIAGGTYLMIDVALHKSKRQCINSMNVIDHSEIFKQILPSLYAQINNDDTAIIRSPTYAWSIVSDNEKTLKLYPIEQ